MTYAIVKTGGKQYRVRQGQTLLVERLPAGEGETVELAPLLWVDGDELVDGEGLAAVSVEARVVAHERGPKLRVVKFKPKRGYRRRTGHRQELTRIEITSLGRQASGGRSRRAAKPAGAEGSAGGAAREGSAGARQARAAASAAQRQAAVAAAEAQAAGQTEEQGDPQEREGASDGA